MHSCIRAHILFLVQYTDIAQKYTYFLWYNIQILHRSTLTFYGTNNLQVLHRSTLTFYGTINIQVLHRSTLTFYSTIYRYCTLYNIVAIRSEGCRK